MYAGLIYSSSKNKASFVVTNHNHLIAFCRWLSSPVRDCSPTESGFRWSFYLEPRVLPCESNPPEADCRQHWKPASCFLPLTIQWRGLAFQPHLEPLSASSWFSHRTAFRWPPGIQVAFSWQFSVLLPWRGFEWISRQRSSSCEHLRRLGMLAGSNMIGRRLIRERLLPDW